MKFRLKEDWVHKSTFLGVETTNTLYEKGQIFTPIDGEYEIMDPSGKLYNIGLEDIKSLDIMEPVEEIELVIEEIPEDDDNFVSNWRIQLDVKTTRKKLKEVERAINEYVKPLL